MDKEVLVDRQIDDGHQLVIQLLQDGFEVSVALWLKTSEEGLWFLYIGSASVRLENIGEAYQTVYASLRKIADCSFSLSKIKLVGLINPIAKEAITLRDRYWNKQPLRLSLHRFGNLQADEAYIYPKIHNLKQSANDAIQEEAHKILGYLDENELEKVREGLNLIVSLARNQHDI